MAEKELQQSIGDSDKCPICLETCQELETLNCQHSFCLHCLQDWMKNKGALDCPTCRQMHPEGLQELQSNALDGETAKHLVKGHGNRKCYCGKDNVEFYCQQCSQYLCSFCKNSHEFLPALKNHILQPINRPTNWPAGTGGAEPLHQPMCPLHEKELEYYCNICETPICQKCTVTDHSEDEGQHETIRASEAFNDFRVTANDLMFLADIHKQQVQEGITQCIANASKLSKTRICLIKDINDTVEEMVKLVRETGKALEAKLDDICEAKKEKSDSQMEELKSTISDVEEKQDYIAKLLKSDEATALQTCQQAIVELQERIDVLPDTEPRDDGKVYFSPETDHILSTVKKHGIGSVSEKPNANIFEIVSGYPKVVTYYQPFHVKIAQHVKCEIDKKDLQAKWEYSSGDEKVEVEQIAEGEFVVNKPCRYIFLNISRRELCLDVTFCNASIKGSPIEILCEQRESIIDNFWQSTGIQGDEGINDLFISQNGYFLVSCNNEIFKFKHSGAYVSKITFSSQSSIRGICELKNILIFCDRGICKITLCQQNGQLIKSISTGNPPSGIDVNEALNLVYVATANCVQVLNLGGNLKVKAIGSKGGLEGQMNEPSSVAVTKEGNIIVADTHNPRIQLFDHEGQFIKLLICGGNKDGMVMEPFKVVVDNDDNIIVASSTKVQLFDSQGKFIKIIHQYQRTSDTYAPKPHVVISLFSHYPRRLAFAKLNSTKILLISY